MRSPATPSVEQFGPLWDKWDGPVREGAKGLGHEVIVPDAATMTQWRDSLKPVSDRYVEDLAKGAFPGARRRVRTAGRFAEAVTRKPVGDRAAHDI